jgi:DNA-binding response OmpR family regulator
LAVVDGQGEELALHGPKVRALLAILLLNGNQDVAGDRLIELLWGEQAPRSAAKSLQVYVSRLRQALGRDREPGDGWSPRSRGTGCGWHPIPGRTADRRAGGVP